MKIIKLQAENIKNIKAIEIIPAGEAVILTGKNGAGKSAVLDSIFLALGGKADVSPIREGEERAEAIVDLGDYVVKKVWTKTGERLEVLGKDGGVMKSPQTLLNAIIGKLTFDPLAFSVMAKDAKGRQQQRELLMQLVGLDFTALEGKRTAIFNERTMKNREINSFSEQLAVMAKPAPELPEQEISLADELAKAGELEKKKKFYDDAVNAAKNHKENAVKERTVAAEKVQKNLSDIGKLREELIIIENKISALKTETLELESFAISPVVELSVTAEHITAEQVQEAKTKLTSIEATNSAIRSGKKYSDLAEKLKKAEQETAALTSVIEALDKEKLEKIKGAAYPIPGLAVDDETVTFNGLPFQKLSTGEQIKISTAIAMSLNPKLKIIMIREGSLLDNESLQAVIEMAKGQGYDLWVEKVDNSGKVGIYIEDGEIRAVNG